MPFVDPIKGTQKPKDQLINDKGAFGPCYDERSSCYADLGATWGVGKRNPVGHTGNPKVDVPTLPRSPKSMDLNERY